MHSPRAKRKRVSLERAAHRAVPLVLIGTALALRLVTLIFFPLPKPLTSAPVPPSPSLLFATLAMTAAAVILGRQNLKRHADDSKTRWYSILLPLGILSGLIGDLLLSQLFVKGPFSLALGMSAYGVGHLSYGIAIWTYCTQSTRGIRTAPNRRRLSFRLLGGILLGAWLVIGIFAWYFVVYQGHTSSSLLISGALVYTVALATMAANAVLAACLQPKLIPLGLGGAVFFASDVVCAATIFNPHCLAMLGRLAQVDLISLTYGPAQFLLVISLVAVRNHIRRGRLHFRAVVPVRFNPGFYPPSV